MSTTSKIKFDPKKINKLNDPARKELQHPDIIWENLALVDPKVLIDIGAGTGFFALPFLQKMQGGQIFACDISEVMINWMKENLPENTKKSIIPTLMEEAKVPLDDGIGDLAYMVNLHHELIKPEKLLSEALRLLKPMGKILIIDWQPIKTEKGPPLKIRVEPAIVKSQLARAGFANIQEKSVLANHFYITAQKK